MVILELSHQVAAYIKTNIPLNNNDPIPNVGDWVIWNRVDIKDHRFRGRVAHKTIDYTSIKNTVIKLIMESVHESDINSTE
jgi:hypothetical protein